MAPISSDYESTGNEKSDDYGQHVVSVDVDVVAAQGHLATDQ